ncbi:Cys-tRNA(Pro) deacylase [Bacillus pseudomycoides]|uniref:Cys-tRNA(Pro) deacylase n=1 Tax=Bacillus pseudomycoides TaxID=64104 RepID=UPI000BEDC090|nr:Cys-tRNA(Pro) deacylase [Bacillus pseudomycoides]PEF76489.1 Cys-tRNA(Pro) deacylase [Bacillus pseudomycoides]PEL87433.1 Cys-tRNA(Pro) deacylase [Bacillus pseudomycoides]PGE97939.1 Cys-tRNA(Pro) deacylase [Bacillus pseudomycoides]PHB21482.1 Cys-tRNA(Pro) deacylase [Bacillus pseudomycoides]PHE36758.1 Cys-tRNA(Pro) deacylase [Bacillus pseudomycoides]
MEYKTNVMRLLDKKKINYKHYSYVDTDAISGIDVALVLGQSPNQVFKTLVTMGKSGQHYVFVVPVNKELDLKKAASSVREKSISMLKSKDLLSLTGYIHGGCSPIGMKKYFPTVIDNSAMELDTIIFSAGKIGYQVELGLDELKKIIRFELHDIVVE